MRRFADLEMPLAELTLCANSGHSSISAGVTIARGTCDRARSTFRVNRDVRKVRICERDRQSSLTSDDSVNGRFSPNPDPRCAYRNDAFPSGDRHSRRCHSIAGSRRSAPLERISVEGRGFGLQHSPLQSRVRRPRLTASGPARPRPEITPGPPICFVARFPCRFRHLV